MQRSPAQGLLVSLRKVLVRKSPYWGPRSSYGVRHLTACAQGAAHRKVCVHPAVGGAQAEVPCRTRAGSMHRLWPPLHPCHSPKVLSPVCHGSNQLGRVCVALYETSGPAIGGNGPVLEDSGPRVPLGLGRLPVPRSDVTAAAVVSRPAYKPCACLFSTLSAWARALSMRPAARLHGGLGRLRIPSYVAADCVFSCNAGLLVWKKCPTMSTKEVPVERFARVAFPSRSVHSTRSLTGGCPFVVNLCSLLP